MSYETKDEGERTNLYLADVEYFTVTDKALLQVLLHGRPQNIIGLAAFSQVYYGKKR